ncbi:MAG: choice-of-anchor L domain-containing protein [Bacteroidia bacterium]
MKFFTSNFSLLTTKLFRLLLIFAFPLFCLFTKQSKAQLVVSSVPTPIQVASTLAGPGVSISNVTYTGNAVSKGTFTASGTNLGINSGIILMTGDIVDAIGPDSFPNAGQDLFGAGDPFLDTLANATTFDATILEFDFVPQNDTVSFRYVFASEEYPEYVCSTYNDAFAFLISGPGITGQVNIAQIPSTTQSVTINSVNGGTVGANGTSGPNCILTYSAYYVDNQGGATIEFDGFTVPLTAMAVVTPCMTYHLKIAIADAGDGAYDSAVFLETGSLSSTPNLNAGPDRDLCTGTSVTLGTNAVSGWTYSWSPSGGLNNAGISNPTATLINNGTTPVLHTYIATASNGTCTLSDTINLTVYPTPVSTFSVTSPLCSGQSSSVTYTGYSDTTATYTWSFPMASSVTGIGRGPYQVAYNNPGNYQVSLTVNDHGCVSTIGSQTIRVITPPVVTLSVPAQFCTGDTIDITASSAAGPNAVYSWSLNTGSILGTSTGSTLTAAFPATTANGQVSVFVTDSGCVSPPVQSNFIVEALPTVSIVSPVSVCTGTSDTIAYLGNAINTSAFNWNFNGLNVVSGSGRGPYVVTWNNDGDYAISLEVDQNGCKNYDTVAVHADLQPLASMILPATPCVNDVAQISFDGVANNLTTYNWTINGSSIPVAGTSGPFNLTWSSSGTYPVELIVANSGCRDTLTDSIIVNPKPVADFSSISVCVYENLILQNNSTFPDSTGGTYAWDLGDQTFSSQQNPLHTYAFYGNYPVQLIVTATNGCADTVASQITINPAPVAAVVGDTVCFGRLSTFTNNSVISAGSISSVNWTIDSTLSLNSQHAQLVFGEAGDHHAMLVVTSNLGCNDTATANSFVLQTPHPDFLPDYRSGCVPLKVHFTNFSSSPDDSAMIYNWTYSNGISDTAFEPVYTFNSPGTYSVNLHVMSSKGCVADTFMSQLIQVYPLPLAAFDYSPQPADIINPQLYFNDQSDAVSSWYWNFGDNNFSNDQNPSHVYAEPGTYEVTLIVRNDFGCFDTTYQEILIDDAYTLWVPNAFTPNGDGRNDVFETKSTGLTDLKMVIFSRWGMEIYETSGLSSFWDGKTSKGQAIEDTYVYRIVATDRKNQQHVVVGHVTVYY